MPKKECRYNPKHKFDSEEAQLEHESKCPDKKKRKDLKECPFTNRHIVTIKQYENHIKKCKFRPKTVKKEEIKNDDENLNNNNNDDNRNDNNKNQNDWNCLDNWGDENDNNEKKNENLKKIQRFIFDGKDTNDDVFEEDDFIFKQCYI